MKKAEIRAIFKPFFVETRSAFHFLEHPYGCQHVGEKINFDQPFDVAGMVRYAGTHVGVEIQWGYVESGIVVSFVELQQPGIFQPGRLFHVRPDQPRAIMLRSLAGMLGHLDDPDFLLPDVPDNLNLVTLDGRRAWSDIVKRRRDQIETDLPGVLAGLARATQTYATTILEGDTTVFAAVVEYHEAGMRRRYPHSF